MNISHLDHLVVTTSNIDTLVDFYTNYLNMKVETFDKQRVCLKFGQSKINLHSLDEGVDYKATNPSSERTLRNAGFVLDDFATHIDKKQLSFRHPYIYTGMAIAAAGVMIANKHYGFGLY